MNCDRASAVFQSNEPPVEIKAESVLVAAQVYQPNLIISEFHGPLTIADLGKAPKIVANWKLGQSSVSGTPKAPERVSLVFDQPAIDLVDRRHDLRIISVQATSKYTAASPRARLRTIP